MSPHYTKAGPGRRHQQGNGKRTAAQRGAGSFSRGLRNAITRKNLARMALRRKAATGSASHE